jgi:hypothetical protein
MTKTIGTAVGFLASLSLAGCYNTLNVKNGGLACGTNDSCPDGFVCLKDSQGGHCWKSGTGPDANSLACTPANASPPFGPFATCSPNQPIGTSTCDPVCQAGCPCDRRCVLDVSTYASFLCEATAPSSSSFSPVQGPCNGTSTQDCSPGSVCIADDVCPWLCFKTCRKDLDCPSNSHCSVIVMLDKNSQAVPNVSLCTPPTEACSPVGSASCSTARTDFNCVFLAGLTGAVNTDSTVCDCKTLHDKKMGAACVTLPDDCQPGAVCVDLGGTLTCRQICDRKASVSACPSGSTCTAIYGSTQYGYCK